MSDDSRVDVNHQEIEEIEITSLPCGFLVCEHVAPLSHQCSGHVQVNVCTKCGSIGADNYPTHEKTMFDDNVGIDECNFCGGRVDLAAGTAQWVPKVERVLGKKDWLGRQTSTDKVVGGYWRFITKK